MSNYGDKRVTQQLVAKAVAFQEARLKMGEALLTDEELGRKVGLSASWVRDHIPAQSRRISAGMPKQKPTAAAKETKAEVKAAPTEAATPAPAPATAAPAAEKPRLSYTAGKHCAKGQHKYVDQGNYLKCTVCNSTKTKAKPKAPKAEAAPKAAEPAAAAPKA